MKLGQTDQCDHQQSQVASKYQLYYEEKTAGAETLGGGLSLGRQRVLQILRACEMSVSLRSVESFHRWFVPWNRSTKEGVHYVLKNGRKEDYDPYTALLRFLNTDITCATFYACLCPWFHRGEEEAVVGGRLCSRLNQWGLHLSQ